MAIDPDDLPSAGAAIDEQRHDTDASGDTRHADHGCGDPGCDDHHPAITPFRREAAKVGRNEPCSCGSGKKYKKCCLTGAA